MRNSKVPAAIFRAELLAVRFHLPRPERSVPARPVQSILWPRCYIPATCRHRTHARAWRVARCTPRACAVDHMARAVFSVMWILAYQVAMSTAKGTAADSSTVVAGQDTMLQQLGVVLGGLPWWAYLVAVAAVLYFTFGRCGDGLRLGVGTDCVAYKSSPTTRPAANEGRGKGQRRC